MTLELAILNALVGSPRAIPSTVISGFVAAYTGEPATLGDIDLALRRLEKKGHVKGTANEDRGTLWKETDDGRLRLS